MSDDEYYIIRPDNYGFTISKWDGGIKPIQQYKLWFDNSKKLHCNCPSGSYRGYCKHTNIYNAWVKHGSIEGIEIRYS